MCDKCLLSFSPHFIQQFSSLTAESTNPLHPSHPSHPPRLQHPISLLIMDSEFTENIKIIPEDSLYLHACVLSCFSHVRLFVTLWIVARQAPLSMGFSRQGYWSGLPCPLTQGSNPHLFCFLHWQVIFTLEPRGKPDYLIYFPTISPACLHLYIEFSLLPILQNQFIGLLIANN